MPYPTISDDGSLVELDLHGASVARGIELVNNAVELCGARGRSTLKIIHGSSSSDNSASAYTLKNELRRIFENGRHQTSVVNSVLLESSILLSFRSHQKDSRTISIFDIDS